VTWQEYGSTHPTIGGKVKIEMARSRSWLTKPTLLRTLLAQLRLAFRLMREPTVPLLTRALPVLAAIYLISPVDFIPDIVPGLGQLDDLSVVVLALELFLRWCPPGARSFHESALARGQRYAPMPASGDVIDAEWRRE
jgi:uncharacterized membrane protein YkvA (DUF1232 family)